MEGIAERAEVGASTVGNFLKGKSQAGPGLLKKLSAVFGVPEGEIENPQPPEEREIDARSLKEDGPRYRTKDRAVSESEGAILNEGQIVTLNRLARRMAEEEVVKELSETLKDKSMPARQRFASARWWINELEKRERDERGGNGD